MRDSKLWTWHMLAGLVIFVLLGLHMTIMHLDTIVGIFNPEDGLPIDWGNVAARGKSLFFAVSYVILLGAALFHGLYGLRNVLLELNPPRGVQTAITTLLVAGGLALFVLGTWAAVAGLRVARAMVVVGG